MSKTHLNTHLLPIIKGCGGTANIAHEGFTTKPLQVTWFPQKPPVPQAHFPPSGSHTTSCPRWHRRCWDFCTTSYRKEGTIVTPHPCVPDGRAGSLRNPSRLPVGLSPSQSFPSACQGMLCTGATGISP